jgi:hypothetical protein
MSEKCLKVKKAKRFHSEGSDDKSALSELASSESSLEDHRKLLREQVE